MTKTHLQVAVIGASAAGLSCAHHLREQGCGVAMFDPAQGATISDFWYDQRWRLVSREKGAHAERYDALVLALPASESAALLEPLLPMTAMRAFTMAPSADHCIWIPAVQVGLCGDWLCGDGEKDASLSGRALAARLLGERVAA